MMKPILTQIVLVGLAGCSSQQPTQPAPQPAHQGHAEQAVDPHAGHRMEASNATLMVRTDPVEVKAGDPTTLNMMIHEPDGTMVKDFEIIHEQRVHLIIVRQGLDRFSHIHPQIDAAGNLKIVHEFPVGGTYRLFADYKAAGKPQRTAVAEATVQGENPVAPELVPNAPGNVMGDGLNATVSIENATAGGETKVTFELFDQENQVVADLEPYLGAMGHLVVISADGKQYVHAHPADAKSAKNQVEFSAHFMQPGIYKAWGQFQRGGRIQTVPFVVRVE